MYRKYSVEEKIEIVEGYLEGKYSLEGKQSTGLFSVPLEQFSKRMVTQLLTK